MNSVRSRCLFALAELEEQLVAKLAPGGVDAGRIRLLMSRHHVELLDSLTALVAPAHENGSAASKAEFDEAYAAEMAETPWGLNGPLKIGAELLEQLQKLVGQGEPFLIYVDLGDGGEFEVVEVRPEANRLVVAVEPDSELVIPHKDARSLLIRIPLAETKLSGGRIAIVSNSEESFSDPPGGGK